MRIKHYTLIVAFLAISMGIPLVQGCSDPFDEYGNGGTEMPVRDGWTSVSMSVEGLGLRNPLTRSLTPEGENSTAAERIRVLVFDKDNKFSYEAKVLSYIPSGDPADKKGKGTMTLLVKNTPSGDTSTFVMLANVTRSANTDADGLAGRHGRKSCNFSLSLCRTRGYGKMGSCRCGVFRTRSGWNTVPVPFPNLELSIWSVP